MTATSVGQLLSPSGSCTATVIASRSRRIAVTAAHCVYASDKQTLAPGHPRRAPGWIAGLEFYPGRDGDRAELGRWPVTRVWLDRGYLDTADPGNDVAFLELADLNGHTAQDTLGAQGVAFHTQAPTGAAVTALGYPTDPPFDGTRLRRCTTPSATIPAPTMLELRCAMTAGSSGGPWLTGFDPVRGTGTVVAVTSINVDARPTDLAGALLDTRARDVLAAADNAATPTTRPGTTEPTRTPPTSTTSLSTRPNSVQAAAGRRVSVVTR